MPPASISQDPSGVASGNLAPNLTGFVEVITAGTEYVLTNVPAASSSSRFYFRIQSIHAVCIDTAGSVGGFWNLYDRPTGEGQVLLSNLPQPQLVAGQDSLVHGRVLIFDFPTPLSSEKSKNIVIKPTANLGTWRIAAMGYYTNVPPTPAP
jgi:hypothetical protein